MSSERLTRAFDRLDDFLSVQRAAGGLTVEAVDLLQLAVGIDQPERQLICERTAALAQEPHIGAVLLGVLVGLFATED